MAPQQPPPPTSRSPPPVPTPTTISAIGDDLLREILLRLPSLPSLVRAALTCRAFLHAVRSSPPFRRRFRAVHPPPLLGLFFDPDVPGIPSFTPLRGRSDPDLAAAVRGADFFLTRLPDDDDAAPWWEIRDCRGGYVLLTNWAAGRIAVYNPLARALDLLPALPDEISDGCVGYFTYEYYILASDEALGPFRVVCTAHNESRARAAVLSSDDREWRVMPWAPATAARPQPEDDKCRLHSGELVGGSIYWAHMTQPYMLVLDTATMRFSRIDMPPYLLGQGHTFRPGETKEGKPCIVCAIEFTLLVLYWRADDDGVHKWVLDKMHHLNTEILQATDGSLEDRGALKVLEITEGVVYLSASETFNNPDFPCWFLSFCLETGELKKLFKTKFDRHVHPYVMAWPPSLVGDNADHLLEGS